MEIFNIFLKTIDTYQIHVYNINVGGEGVRSKDLMKIIEKDGWYLVNIKGSHHQFKHPTKKGRVTIPHPKKDLPKGTIKSILKQAGLE